MPSASASKTPCVYIMASRPGGSLYIGVTSNLLQRVGQHKAEVAPGHTSRYHVERLVWYEAHESMRSAIEREKAVKKWLRKWKEELIEKANPLWRDLYGDLW